MIRRKGCVVLAGWCVMNLMSLRNPRRVAIVEPGATMSWAWIERLDIKKVTSKALAERTLLMG